MAGARRVGQRAKDVEGRANADLAPHRAGVAHGRVEPGREHEADAGLRFNGWSTRPGFESYFHPFASMLDNLTMTQFIHNATARVNGAEVDAHPNNFFIASRLADEAATT